MTATTENMTARLIVCERTNDWATALRRELVEAGIRVWETRTMADCWLELAKSPASFIVLELGDQREELLSHLMNQSREFPMARIAIVADRRLAAYEWLMRETGAVDFVRSRRRAGKLAQLALRHLAQAPPPQQTLTERIWANLPWKKAASMSHQD